MNIESNQAAYRSALSNITKEIRNPDGIVAARLMDRVSNAHRYGLLCGIGDNQRLADIAAARVA